MFKGKFSHKMQHNDYDCGVACVATVLHHYNQSYNFNDLKYELNTNLNGTSILDIYKAFVHYGFKSKVYKIKNDIETVLKNVKLPCIALLNNEDVNHYVVIQKISKNNLVISDPLDLKVKKEALSTFSEKFSGVLLLPEPELNKLKETQGNKVKQHSYPSKLFNFIKTEKGFLILTFILSLLLTVFGVATSYFTGILLDGIIPQNLKDALYFVALIFISFAFLQASFQYLRDRLIIKMSIKLETKLTTSYFNHLLKTPVYQIKNKEIGEFISRFNDALIITQTFSTTLIATIVDFLLIFISGYLMFYVSGKMFALVLIPVLLYSIICYLFFENLSNKNRKAMEGHANVNSFFIQMLNGIENIKALSKEKSISAMSVSKVDEYIKKVLKLQNTNNNSLYLKNIIQYIFPMVVLWVGALQVMSSQLTTGALITFLSLSAFFFTSVQHIASIQPQIQQSIIAADRFFDILESSLVEDDDNGQIIEGKIKNIRVDNLSFNYKNEEPLLKDFSFEINENQIVSFVGKSGSGKSTLAKLLIRFLETSKNTIYVNDIDINDINLKSLREKVCYINDKRFFIPGTIRENLTLGKAFSDDEIVNACKAACIHDFINGLHKGYDFPVMEDSSNFSLGQSQRLSLARAILQKPDVLILDEVLSNVDEENALKIMKNLKNMDIIVISINHNSCLFDYYDQIYDFSKERISEFNRGVNL
ncbi:peptidase domain-containing ABC transporter [Bacillus cereus]|nr:peptidase domain-containing ABC transporter [Bacillus cereus]